jgi:hypothetical protein
MIARTLTLRLEAYILLLQSYFIQISSIRNLKRVTYFAVIPAFAFMSSLLLR